MMPERADFARFSRTDAVRADLKAKSIRGAVFFASSNAIDLLLRFLSIAVLARFLTPEDFGLIAMVAALTSIVEGVRDLGLSTATVQRREITHAQVSNLFWLNVVVGAAFAAAFTLAAPFIADFYHEPRLIAVAIALSLAFVWGGLTVQHEALMSRQIRQGEIAVIRLTASIVSIAVAIMIALEGWGYWALVWREIVRSALIAVGVWIRCAWLPGIPRRNVGTRGLVRFGGELTATNLFFHFIANIDKLLIGRFFGATPLGLYRQAEQLLLAPIEQLNGSIMSVGQPALSALQSDPPRYRRYYEQIVFMVALTTVPLGLYVSFFADEITLLMLGPNWEAAAIFVCIFGIAAMIRPALGTSGFVLVTCGYSTRLLALAMANSAVLVILLVAALPWGPTGIALAHLGTSVLMAVPKLYFSFLQTPVTVGGFLVAVRAPVIASTLMAAGLFTLRAYEPTEIAWVSLLLGAAVGCTTYLLGLWVQRDARSNLISALRASHAAFQRRRSADGAGLP